MTDIWEPRPAVPEPLTSGEQYCAECGHVICWVLQDGEPVEVGRYVATGNREVDMMRASEEWAGYYLKNVENGNRSKLP